MIDPRHLTLSQWCDAVSLALATSAPPVKLRDGDDWKEWAYIVLAVPSVASFSPPAPEYYPDWRGWAERFVECVLL